MKNGSEKRVKIHAHVLRLNVNNTGAAVKFRFARSVSILPPPTVATSSISRGTAKTPISSFC